MKLSGHQFKQFQEALVSALPSSHALELMARVQLDLHLRRIVADVGLDEQTSALIRWAEANGRLDELVEKSAAAVAGNAALQAFAEQYRKARHLAHVMEPAAPSDDLMAGDLLPKMCDREKQVFKFRDSFSSVFQQSPNHPQVFLIHGSRREAHKSLVDRLVHTQIKKFAKFSAKGEEQNAAVGFWEMQETEWPLYEDIEERRKRLFSWLFYKCELDYTLPQAVSNFSPSSFRELLVRRPEQVHVFRHDIPFDRWDTTTTRLVGDYLNFWDEVKGSADVKQVIIFLNIMYMQAAGVWGRVREALRFGGAGDNSGRASVISALARSHALPSKPPRFCTPCAVLDELPEVTREDVRSWFSRYRIGLEADWDEACDRIFGRRETKNMVEVEKALEKVYEEYLEKELARRRKTAELGVLRSAYAA